jgi:hypothetical protein
MPSGVVRNCEAFCRIWVGRGNSPPNCSNMPANTGTMKISMNVVSSTAIANTMTG